MNNANGGNIIYKFIGDNKDLTNTVNGIKGGLGKLGGVAKGVGIAVAGMTTAVTTGLGEITRRAVLANGEFEQIQEGAKKVFDEIDFKKIEEDANSAYKTMNMSAKDYLNIMNQVGGAFSASMGDEKGYEVAKRGLQAISDYATGLGKDINLLSEKYQKISRSTSSYLSIADNFPEILPQTTKGFLEQAQAAGFLEGSYEKLNEVPVAEYQEALAKMLEKGVEAQNLAGNTLRESTQTLTGSISAAKTSLQNFFSGTGSIDDVVSSLTTAGEQIGKAIQKMLPKIIEGISKLIKSIAPKIPGAIKELLPSLIQGASDMVTELVNMAPQLIQTFAEMLPFLIENAVQMFINICNAFAEQAPTIIPIIVNAIVDGLIALLDNADVVIEAALSLIIGLTEGIINSLPVLIEKLPTIIEKIITSLISLAPRLLVCGVQFIFAILNGINETVGSIISAFWTLITKTIPNAIRDGLGRVFDVGKDIIKGLWNGIKNFDLIGSMKNLARDALNGFKSMLGIHSPSTEFEYLGDMSMLGYTNAIEDAKGSLEDAMKSTFSIAPSIVGGNTNLSPNIVVQNYTNIETDPLGQTVRTIKTFANGAKNDFNYGMGV
jgi:flagellar biosynthesis/type III secretory pathway protein FliH